MWAEYNAMVAQNLQAILVRVPVNRIMTSPPPPPPPVAHLAGHGGWSFGYDFKSWLQCRYSHYHNKKLLIAVSSVCAPDKHVFRNLNLFQFSSKTAIVCKTPSQHLYFMNIGCCVQKFWTANWSKITAHTVPPHSRKQRQSNHWSYNLNVAPTKMDLFSLCL